MRRKSDEDDSPECPYCLETMELIRRWPRTGGHPERKSFGCPGCDVTFTEVVTGGVPLPERANVLHLEPCHVRH